MKFHKIAWWLVVIGGLNWLLVGLFQWDLFGLLGMSMSSLLARVVYLLVGVSTLYLVFSKKKDMMNKPMGQMGM